MAGYLPQVIFYVAIELQRFFPTEFTGGLTDVLFVLWRNGAITTVYDFVNSIEKVIIFYQITKFLLRKIQKSASTIHITCKQLIINGLVYE